MPFGQLVIGPPGSGKTTYCHGLHQYLTALGMLYCMEYLQANLDWLKEKLEPLADSNVYILLDCPGQVELFTQHSHFKQVVDVLTKSWHWRLAAVHLVDAHLCTDPAKYISALLLSLSTMLHLELPQINVLSKVDLVKHYGELAFNLDFYTEVHDLGYLVAAMGPGPFSARFRALSSQLCELVEDYGLVAFTPLAIQEHTSVERLIGLVDKANGAVYANLDKPPVPVPAELLAAAAHRAADDDIWTSMQEKYIDVDKAGGLPAGSSQLQPLEQGAAGPSKGQLLPLQAGGIVAPDVLQRHPMDEG
eukprot:gene6624-6852_t